MKKYSTIHKQKYTIQKYRKHKIQKKYTIKIPRIQEEKQTNNKYKNKNNKKTATNIRNITNNNKK